MQDIEPVGSQVALPSLHGEVSADITALTTALGIPRNVLASDEEIVEAWQQLPRELRAIPLHRRTEIGEFIARMCVAVRAGLLDAAINYIWNATVLHLRRRMRDFGLPTISQLLQRTFEENTLMDLQDSEIISLCLQLNLITEEGFFFLDQCRDIRNSFSAAHPPVGHINDREMVTFLNRCIRSALSDESSPVGVDFSEFIAAVKGQHFTTEQREAWIDRLEATHDAQRRLLFVTLHGIYCDPASFNKCVPMLLSFAMDTS